MLVRKDGNSYDKTVHFLAKLPGICPVYCANGNHEQKLKELPDKYEQSYEGVQKSTDGMLESTCLENASETVKLDEVPVRTFWPGDSASERMQDLERKNFR